MAKSREILKLVARSWHHGVGMTMMIFCQRKKLLSGSVGSKFYAQSHVERFLISLFPRSGQINRLTLRHYMNFFDFSGLRLDNAFRSVSRFVHFVNFFDPFHRRLCGKLYLKAETQQVDRILEQFSRQYWAGNPDSIYGSASPSFASTPARVSS